MEIRMNYCTFCGRFIGRGIDQCPYCGSPDRMELPVPSAGAETGAAEYLEGETIVLNGREYRVREAIGIGGYGLILRVEEEGTGGQFALKVPVTTGGRLARNRDFSTREKDESERSIQSEAAVLEKVSSAHVIRVFQTGSAVLKNEGTGDPFPAILMELAVCTLRDIVQLEESGRIVLPMTEKLEITSSIVETIGELHGSGIIHRDIALENIFVVERGGCIHYVMADFGTSREQNAAKGDKTTGIVGRDKYIDPMRFDRRYRRDPRIDIFTAGIVITEVFIGSQWDNIVYEPLTDLDFEREFLNNYASAQIDKRIVKFISKALKSDISKRYRNAAEMKRKFFRIKESVLRSLGSRKIVRNIDLVYNIPIPFPQKGSTGETVIRYENHKKINLDTDRKTVIRFGGGKVSGARLKKNPFFMIGYRGSEVRITPDYRRIAREMFFFEKDKFCEDRGILYFTGRMEVEIAPGIRYG